METFPLSNGIEMPKVGLGSYAIPTEFFTQVISDAYNCGYRRFDTARYYNNEILIGKALKDLGINRNEIFLQTKLGIGEIYFGKYRHGRGRFLNIRMPFSIRHFIHDSMRKLGTDYLDMMLVHWPAPGFEKIYRTIEKMYRDGEIRAIGVCSCLPPHIEYLMQRCEIMPMLNQFEISPLNTQKQLVQYCKENNIQPEAMSTFSHFRDTSPRMEIFENPQLLEIASRHGKSVAQIVNRWLIQQGISIVPKSKSAIHLQENISIFDFELSKEEMHAIDSMDGGKFLNYNPKSAIWSLPKEMRNSHWFL